MVIDTFYVEELKVSARKVSNSEILQSSDVKKKKEATHSGKLIRIRKEGK